MSELEELRAQNAWFRSMLLNTSIRGFAVRHGGQEVWRSWRHNMLAQGRNVSAERQGWETLPDQDKDLDVAICYDVLRKFAEFVLDSSQAQ